MTEEKDLARKEMLARTLEWLVSSDEIRFTRLSWAVKNLYLTDHAAYALSEYGFAPKRIQDAGIGEGWVKQLGGVSAKAHEDYDHKKHRNVMGIEEIARMVGNQNPKNYSWSLEALNGAKPMELTEKGKTMAKLSHKPMEHFTNPLDGAKDFARAIAGPGPNFY